MSLTVISEIVDGHRFRLAYLGYARGYIIQIKQGKSYQTVEELGWLNEADARAFFHKFCGRPLFGVQTQK